MHIVWLLSFLFVAMLGESRLSALPETAHHRSPPGVVMDVYAIASDPPGKVRVAPGGGRVLTPVILFKPASGENIRAPAIIMINRGPNSNPGRAYEPTRWAAERLAARGYTVLSLQTHMDRGFPYFPFEETVYEIDAALTSLEQRGYESFILIGNGYGAIAAAYYVANTADPALDKAGVRRAVAVVLIDPLTELKKYPGLDIEEDYALVMSKAAQEFATGQNGYVESRTTEVGAQAGGGRDRLGSGFFIAPAEAFLNYWGPAAAARNERALRDTPVPTLVMAHRSNPAVSLNTLKRHASASERIELREYRGAAFGPSSFDAAVDDMSRWLEAEGLGPQPRVSESFIDTVAADGTVLPGMVYMPEARDPNRPVLLLLHGRSGDIIQSSTHWMGWRLAQKGYVVVAPSLRISGIGGIQTATRAQTIEDLTAWMGTLQKLGYDNVIAAGHSNGGIWMSDYKVVSGDPRIRGMIYFAPTANVLSWRERSADPQLMAQLEQARRAVASGNGSRKVFGIQSATLVHDSLREEAVSHPERLAKIRVPGLFVIGSEDSIFHRPGVRDRLAQAYGGKLEQITYQGVGHGLREAKDKIAVDIDRWIRKHFPAADGARP